MSRNELLESLAKAVATTDHDDPKGLVNIRDQFSALKEELGDDVPAALLDSCESALESLTSLLWQEAEDPVDCYGFIEAVVGYTQEVFQALGGGGNVDSIAIPCPKGGKAAAPEQEDNLDSELLTMFVSGCQEALEELEGQILMLDQSDADEDRVAEIRRRVHTIKGECGVLSLGAAQKLCHTAEDLVDQYTDARQPLPGDVLLSLVDWLNRYIKALGEDPTAAPPEDEELIGQLRDSAAQLTGAATETEAPTPAPEPMAVEPEAVAEEPAPEPEVSAPEPEAVEPAAVAEAPEPEPEAIVEEPAPEPEVAPTPVEAPAASSAADIDPTERVVFDADTLSDPMVPDVLSEGLQHLDDAEAAMLEMEDTPDDVELVDRIFRAFHTIKGVAGFMNLEMIVAVAHKSETLLDDFRKGVQKCTPDYLNLIFQSRDIMGQLLGALGGEQAPLVIDVMALLDRLSAAKDEVAAGPAPEAAPEVVPEAAPANYHVLQQVEAAPAAAPPAFDEIPTPPANAPAAANPAAPPKARTTQKIEQTVKVGTLRLDSLVDMVGELVIAQQMVTQDPVVSAITSERVNRNLGQVAKITRDLQEAAMSLRMVPLRTTFQKMARLVRDVSRKANKKVALSIVGEDTELDRTVVEEIGDPLVHLIRNAIDHGLEGVEERLQAGKPAAGKLELRAFHQGGSIVIEIVDDGRGLNRERILAKGIERGLIPPEVNVDEIPDGDVWKMIFKPGFSTAEKVTDISGRGVGMDVVRRNIESMRGKIDITSTAGHGSVFTLRLPLTLAIIDGMIVRVGDNRYVVPTLSIEQSFRPTTEQLHSILNRGEMVKVRGRLLPIRRLRETFELSTGEEDLCQGILLLLEVAGQRICLLVDEILGQHQVVIKSLGKGLPKIEGVSGGAILGDGHVALIIDVDSLVEEAVRAAV